MNRMLDEWLKSYNRLDEKYDKLWNKSENYEKRGDVKRANWCNRRMDTISDFQDGMVEALNIFGYDVKYQYGKNVIVDYKKQDE